MILFFISSDIGVKGIIYDLLKDFILHRLVIKNKKMIKIPKIPIVVPPSINKIRYHLMAAVSSGSTITRALIAVMATMIIIMGETIPALTAASPNIRAPTMERAELETLGIR